MHHIRNLFQQPIYRSIFIVMLAGFILMSVAIGVFEYRVVQKNIQEVEASEKTELYFVEMIVDSQIKGIVEDLHFLEESYLINVQEENRQALIQTMWTIFSKHQGIYDQIRFIDPEGMELIRINYENGVAYMVDSDELQNKSDRYYFTETISLEPDQVYVSPMDLNVENGTVQIPYKPMIRLGMPVYFQDELLGVIILNYLADNVLQEVTYFNDRYTGDVYILNQDGNILFSPNEAMNFAFMKKNGAIENLEQLLPDVWEQILYGKRSIVNSDFISSVNRLNFCQAFNDGDRAIVSDVSWYLVITQSTDEAWLMNISYDFKVLLANIIIHYGIYYLVFFIIIFIWFVVVRTKRLQEAYQNRQLAVINTIPNQVWVADSKGEILFYNKALANQFSSDKTIRLIEEWSPYIYEEDREEVVSVYKQLIKEHKPFQVEFRMKGTTDSYRWYIGRGNYLKNRDHEDEFYGSNTDITDLKIAEDRIRNIAIKDELTGLNNRHFLDIIIEKQMEIADRFDQPISMILIDIDHFKKVNDQYGHVKGDEVLRHIAMIIRESIRGSDYAIRYGGEEFMILLPGMSQDYVVDFSERLRHRVETTDFNLLSRVTISAGVARRFKSESVQLWLKRTDKALYRAKDEGRNKVVLSNEEDAHPLRLYEWHAEWEVGNEIIDDDHKELVSYLKDFIKVLDSESDGIEINEELERLVRRIYLHFRTEENELRLYSRQFSKEHMEEHRRMESKIRYYKSGVEKKEINIYAFISYIIDEVIVNHLKGEVNDMRNLIANNL